MPAAVVIFSITRICTWFVPTAAAISEVGKDSETPTDFCVVANFGPVSQFKD